MELQRLFAFTTLVIGTLGALGGGVAGLVRGLSYPPTLFFAVIEGGILAGVPAVALGAVVGCVVVLAYRVCFRRSEPCR